MINNDNNLKDFLQVELKVRILDHKLLDIAPNFNWTSSNV